MDTTLEQNTSSAAPSAHDRRYDRQLRLWASSGQQALEQAQILVVGASATAAQSIKNLVLPGIGSVTILDENVVTAADIANNFFLEQSSLGKSRAAELLRLLLELNDSVKGDTITQPLQDWLTSTSNALARFSLVISVDQPTANTNILASQCWQERIPFLTIRTTGFYSYIRTQYQEVTLIDTHPENLVDLRLDAPFPELLEFASQVDFDNSDSFQHTHIPAIIIILKALQHWATLYPAHPLPKPGKELRELKEWISKQRKFEDSENFDQAASFLSRYDIFRPTRVPDHIEQMFDDPECENISEKSSLFWLQIRALREYCRSSPEYNPSKLLPLTGVLPDMKATSEGYGKLTTIYRTKARSDLQYFRQILQQVCLSVNIKKETMDTLPGLSEQDLAFFLKNAAHVKVLRGLPLKIGGDIFDIDPTQKVSSWINMQPDEIKATFDSLHITNTDSENGSTPPTELLGLYFALLIEEQFITAHNRRPSSTSDDMVALDSLAKSTLANLGVPYTNLPLPITQYFQEIARVSGAELAPISAWVGGVVAQEAIKIITLQYVPINGTEVIDGISSVTQVFSCKPSE